MKPGEDKNCTTNKGFTPLHFAVEEGHLTVVKYLINEIGADKNCTTNEGFTLLHCAVCCGLQESIVDYLIDECQVNVNCRDTRNCTPLYYAAYNGHTQIAIKLINQLPSLIYTKDYANKTVLHVKKPYKIQHCIVQLSKVT